MVVPYATAGILARGNFMLAVSWHVNERNLHAVEGWCQCGGIRNSAGMRNLITCFRMLACRGARAAHPRRQGPMRIRTWIAFAVLWSGPAMASDFYGGKTISFVVGLAPGGGYDVYARLLARYFPK